MERVYFRDLYIVNDSINLNRYRLSFGNLLTEAEKAERNIFLVEDRQVSRRFDLLGCGLQNDSR